MIIQKPLKLILFFIPICFVAGCRFSPSNEDIVNWLRQNCADTNARWIVEPKYEQLAVFQGTNILYMINHHNEIILRNLKGDSLNTGMTENPDMIFEKEGLWVIIKNGAKMCFNARTGRYFDASKYRYISISDSVLRVKKDGKYGFVDYDNNELVPFIFDDASVFINGRASVKKNGLWGVINKSGEQLLDCTYQSPLQFSADLMYSYINGKKYGSTQEGKKCV